MTENLHKVVIVGGGAGGLELATKLGDSLGKKQKAHITLVDGKKPTYGSLYCMKLLQEALIQTKMNWIIWPRPIGTISIFVLVR